MGRQKHVSNVPDISCSFDAVEPGANPQTHLYTKLAGTPFNVDVLALNSDTTINTSYKGTVSVDLVDVCPNGTALNTAQSITFKGGDKGRYTVSLASSTAAPTAKVRIKAGGGAKDACSSDALAIRPTNFTITSTDATNSGTSSTPAIKAGTAFNLTSSSVAGYNGTPVVNNAAGMVVGTTNAGSIGGAFAAAAPATGTATANTFTYSEVGNFGLNQNAVYDSTFTTVDQPGDCVVSTTTPSLNFSNTLDASGRYGCYIGSAAVPQTTGTSGFGRFIPDHFDTAVVPVSGVPLACPGTLNCPADANHKGMVYSGQTFSLSVTARNASGATTKNYDSGNVYAKTANLSTVGVFGTTNAVSGAGVLGISSVSAFTAGTLTEANESYTFTTLPNAPTDIYIRADDGEASSLRATNPTTTSVEGGVTVVTGHIKVSNAYGSELLPLTLTAVAQYYSAGGWVNSITDGVTNLTLAASYNVVKQGVTTGTTIPAPSGSNTLSNGLLPIVLGAPAGGATGAATVSPTAPGYLPVIPGTATFGLYKGNNGFIYRREEY